MSASDAGAAVDKGDWRSSVIQSYRNNEVREIAKILASIEGESTPVASKMMLSMKFEDQIFKSASSLDDYKKKIAKRLKKLQKAYAQQKSAADGDPATKSAGDTSSDEQQRQELLLKLRQTYGDTILYVIKNAPAAMSDIERKLGQDKVDQFNIHVTSCQEWAIELGIWKKEKGTTDDKAEPASSAMEETSTMSKAKEQEEEKLPSLSQLQRLEQHLEKRAKNIRDYVVKHADPDLFLMETMERKDMEVAANKRATKLLAVNLSKRIQYIQQQQLQHQQGGRSSSQNQSQLPTSSGEDTNAAPLQALQQALEKAQASVPPPTRNDSRQLEASLRHLDKMRAASTALMNYWTLGEDRVATAPPQTRKRIFDVMSESMEFIVNKMKEKKSQLEGMEDTLTLQDAWTKRMELPPPISQVEDPVNEMDTSSPPTRKRPPLNNYKPYIKARLLFHPDRKTPSNLLAAVRRKGARLVRPRSASGNVTTTHLVLEFGQAFTMTIYLSPLTVNIRAMTPPSKNETVAEGSPMQDYFESPSNIDGAACWQPLSYGLANTTTQTSSRTDGIVSPHVLSVWGVSSTYDSIGHVVEERLRDASTRATYLLRNCFRNHVKDKSVDFEVEILEGSALLEFLNVARSTYMPDWQDYDY
jgi:hypothetical protein